MNVGIGKLIDDLTELDYQNVSVKQDSQGIQYAVISGFEIPAGTFAGRKIDLAIPAPADYPRSFGASVHIKSDPHLVPFEHIPNVRNVVASNLGSEWQYWSYRFNVGTISPTTELISQINEIFRKN